MEPKTLPSAPASNLACPTNQETVSEPIPYSNWNAPWTLASVPAGEIEVETSQWHQEQSYRTIYIVGKYNHAYKVIINPAHLSGLKDWNFGLNLKYKPTQPGKSQKAVYGTQKATKDARSLWLRHAAHKISSEDHSEVQPAYRYFARLNGLHEALAREILIYDISVSTPLVRRKLAKNLVISYLSYEPDYDSFDTGFQQGVTKNVRQNLGHFGLPAERGYRYK